MTARDKRIEKLCKEFGDAMQEFITYAEQHPNELLTGDAHAGNISSNEGYRGRHGSVLDSFSRENTHHYE